MNVEGKDRVDVFGDFGVEGGPHSRVDRDHALGLCRRHRRHGRRRREREVGRRRWGQGLGLAVAHRLRLLFTKAKGGLRRLVAQDAAWYVETGVPPIAASAERGLVRLLEPPISALLTSGF